MLAFHSDENKGRTNEKSFPPVKQNFKHVGSTAGQNKNQSSVISDSKASLKTNSDKSSLLATRNGCQRVQDKNGDTAGNVLNKIAQEKINDGNTKADVRNENTEQELCKTLKVQEVESADSKEVEKISRDEEKSVFSAQSQDLKTVSFLENKQKLSLNFETRSDQGEEPSNEDFDNRWSARSEQDCQSTSNIMDKDEKKDESKTQISIKEESKKVKCEPQKQPKLVVNTAACTASTSTTSTSSSASTVTSEKQGVTATISITAMKTTPSIIEESTDELKKAKLLSADENQPSGAIHLDQDLHDMKNSSNASQKSNQLHVSNSRSKDSNSTESFQKTADIYAGGSIQQRQHQRRRHIQQQQQQQQQRKEEQNHQAQRRKQRDRNLQQQNLQQRRKMQDKSILSKSQSENIRQQQPHAAQLQQPPGQKVEQNQFTTGRDVSDTKERHDIKAVMKLSLGAKEGKTSQTDKRSGPSCTEKFLPTPEAAGMPEIEKIIEQGETIKENNLAIIKENKNSDCIKQAEAKNERPGAPIEDNQSSCLNNTKAATVTMATQENTEIIAGSDGNGGDISNGSFDDGGGGGGGGGDKTCADVNDAATLVRTKATSKAVSRDGGDGKADTGYSESGDAHVGKCSREMRENERGRTKPRDLVSQKEDMIAETNQSLVCGHQLSAGERAHCSFRDNHSQGKTGKTEGSLFSVPVHRVEAVLVNSVTTTAILDQRPPEAVKPPEADSTSQGNSGQVSLSHSTQVQSNTSLAVAESFVKDKNSHVGGGDKIDSVRSNANSVRTNDVLNESEIPDIVSEDLNNLSNSKGGDNLSNDGETIERISPRNLNRVDTVGGLLSVIGEDTVDYTGLCEEDVNCSKPTVKSSSGVSDPPVKLDRVHSNFAEQKSVGKNKTPVGYSLENRGTVSQDKVFLTNQSKRRAKDGYDAETPDADTEKPRQLTDISEKSKHVADVTSAADGKPEGILPNLSHDVTGISVELPCTTILGGDNTTSDRIDNKDQSINGLSVNYVDHTVYLSSKDIHSSLVKDKDKQYGIDRNISSKPEVKDGVRNMFDSSLPGENISGSNIGRHVFVSHDSDASTGIKSVKSMTQTFESLSKLSSELNKTHDPLVQMVKNSKLDENNFHAVTPKEKCQTYPAVWRNNLQVTQDCENRDNPDMSATMRYDSFPHENRFDEPNTKSLNSTKSVILQKPVLVRPKTAGLSDFSPTENEDLWSLNTGEDDDDHIQFIEVEQDFFKVFGDNEETAAILLATKIDTVQKNETYSMPGGSNRVRNQGAINKVENRNVTNERTRDVLERDGAMIGKNFWMSHNPNVTVPHQTMTVHSRSDNYILDADSERAGSVEAMTSQDATGQLMTKVTGKGLGKFPGTTRNQNFASNSKNKVTETAKQGTQKHYKNLRLNGPGFQRSDPKNRPQRHWKQHETHRSVKRNSVLSQQGLALAHDEYLSGVTLIGNKTTDLFAKAGLSQSNHGKAAQPHHRPAVNGNTRVPTITTTTTTTSTAAISHRDGKDFKNVLEEPVEKLLTPYLSNEFTTLGVKAGKITVTTQPQPHVQPKPQSQPQLQPQNQPQPPPSLQPKPVSTFSYASQKTLFSQQEQQQIQHNHQPSRQGQQPSQQERKQDPQSQKQQQKQTREPQQKHFHHQRRQNLKSKFLAADNEILNHPEAARRRPQPLSRDLPSPPATTANISASRDTFFVRDELFASSGNDSVYFPTVRRRIHSEADINSSQYNADIEAEQDLYQRSDFFLTKSNNKNGQFHHGNDYFSDDAKYVRRAVNRIKEVNTRIEVNISKSPTKQMRNTNDMVAANYITNQQTNYRVSKGNDNTGATPVSTSTNPALKNVPNKHLNRHVIGGAAAEFSQAKNRTGNTVGGDRENGDVGEVGIRHTANKHKNQHGGKFLPPPPPPPFSPPQVQLNQASSSSSSSSSLAVTSKVSALGNLAANDPKRMTSFNPYMQAADRIISGFSETQHAIKGRSNASVLTNTALVKHFNGNNNNRSNGADISQAFPETASAYGNSNNPGFPAKLGTLGVTTANPNTGNVSLRMKGGKDGTDSLAAQKPRKLKPIMHQPGGHRFNQNFTSGLR